MICRDEENFQLFFANKQQSMCIQIIFKLVWQYHCNFIGLYAYTRMAPAVISTVLRIYFLKWILFETIHFCVQVRVSITFSYCLYGTANTNRTQLLNPSWLVNSRPPCLKMIAVHADTILLLKGGRMQDISRCYLRTYGLYSNVVLLVITCDIMTYLPAPSSSPFQFFCLALHFLLKIWSKSKSSGIPLWEFFHWLQWVSF